MLIALLLATGLATGSMTILPGPNQGDFDYWSDSDLSFLLETSGTTGKTVVSLDVTCVAEDGTPLIPVHFVRGKSKWDRNPTIHLPNINQHYACDAVMKIDGTTVDSEHFTVN